MDCSIGTCPYGISWFSAGLPSTIHSPAECSDMGFCDRQNRKCICRPGWYGNACEYFDCHRDSNGNACNNRGKCVTTKDYYNVYGYTYNDWDRNSFYTCSCDTIPKNLSTVHKFVPQRVSGLEVTTPPILTKTSLAYDCSDISDADKLT